MPRNLALASRFVGSASTLSQQARSTVGGRQKPLDSDAQRQQGGCRTISTFSCDIASALSR